MEQIPDSVVYKLVRVEVDGRLVPATDEEVMEVEELLMDNKNEMYIADIGQDADCTSNGLFQPENGRGQPDKLSVRLEGNDPSLVHGLSDDQNKECSVGEYSHLSDKPVEGDSSASAIIASTKPDFSKIKGEICLDNLSIRELQETFRATFGRETIVKDKIWLIRRIAMGLTNSCDVTTTSFIIKDIKLVKKDKEETCNNMGVSSVEDAVTKTDLKKKSSPIYTGQQQDKQVVSDQKLDTMNEVCENEDSHAEQRAAKRARKPTRRYIEELSEEFTELNARFTAPNDHSTVGYVCEKSVFRPIGNTSSDGRPMITRLHSLGGSRIQVPYVSRIRRSRPRTNYTALLVISHLEEDSQLVVSQTVGMDPQPELGNVNTLENPVDRVVTVPKASGCVRRKHHRAWTLSEVVKLVDGVSRYGAGRWSEIKKVAFSSYAYRTPVDLKDKWRNLLKASFVQGTPNKEISSRKSNGATPVPAPILLKVRELTELHAQVSPNCSASKSDKSIGSGAR